MRYINLRLTYLLYLPTGALPLDPAGGFRPPDSLPVPLPNQSPGSAPAAFCILASSYTVRKMRSAYAPLLGQV